MILNVRKVVLAYTGCVTEVSLEMGLIDASWIAFDLIDVEIKQIHLWKGEGTLLGSSAIVCE